MQSAAFVPRTDRAHLRGQRAKAAALAAGSCAWEAALITIGAVFDRAYDDPNWTKMVAERVIARSVGHFEVRAKYKAIADGIEAAHGSGATLDQAIAAVEIWLQHERGETERYHRVGWSRPRIGLSVLTEVRLILRWLRWRGLAEQFPAIFAIATTPLHLEARPVFLIAAE